MVSSLCRLCGEKEKNVSHLFFKCKVAWRIWELCLSWLGCVSVNHFDAKVHFMMFCPCEWSNVQSLGGKGDCGLFL